MFLVHIARGDDLALPAESSELAVVVASDTAAADDCNSNLVIRAVVAFHGTCVLAELHCFAGSGAIPAEALYQIARSEFTIAPPPAGSPRFARGTEKRARLVPPAGRGNLKEGFSVLLVIINFTHVIGIISPRHLRRRLSA